MANAQFGSVVAPTPAARVSVAADPGGLTCQWSRSCTARPCRCVWGSEAAMAGAKTKVAAAMAGGRIKVASARAGPKPKMEAEQLRRWNAPEDSVNAEHFIVAQKAIEKIEACPVLDGIKSAPSNRARCD